MSMILDRFWALARIEMYALLSLVATTANVCAAQLLVDRDCRFVIEVPGFIGSTHLDYRAQKGAIFTQNADGKFCGHVTAATPFGETDSEDCYVVSSGQLVSGRYSNKVASSDCVLSDASHIQAAYSSTDFLPYQGTGLANLRGQAFLKTVGGDVKTCAGEDVLVLPATPYVDELLDKASAGVSVDVDAHLSALLHRTICDAQGNFSFSALPAQRWYVLTKVTWGVPHIEGPGERPGPLTALLLHIPPPPATDEQGGQLLQAVMLVPGDNQVFLTDRDRK